MYRCIPSFIFSSRACFSGDIAPDHSPADDVRSRECEALRAWAIPARRCSSRATASGSWPLSGSGCRTWCTTRSRSRGRATAGSVSSSTPRRAALELDARGGGREPHAPPLRLAPAPAAPLGPLPARGPDRRHHARLPAAHRASRRDRARRAGAGRRARDDERTVDTPDLDERLMRVVWSLADEPPSAELALDDLARRAHMSRHHFARAFRKALGLTPMA